MPFTTKELESTEAVVGVYVQIAPHIERNELIPGEVRAKIRYLVTNMDAGQLVGGTVKACDVAVKLISTFGKASLDEVGRRIGSVLERIMVDDRLGYGAKAYEDGKECAVIMTEAMVANGTADFSGVFDVNDRDVALHQMRAWGALLVASILVLAAMHGMTISKAAQRLALEIQTITPTG